MGFVGAFARAFRVGILPAMPGRGHRLRAARAIAAACAAVAVAGVAAVGCDSHSKPQVVGDPTSPARVTSSASNAPVPGTPSKTVEGAQETPSKSAFPSAEAQIPAAVGVVRAFFDGLNYEIDNEGDEAKLVPLFTGDCTRCAESASTLQSIFLKGNTVRGGHYHVVKVDKAYATDVARVSVVVTESADPGQVIDKYGTVVQSYPGLRPIQQTFYVAVDHDPPLILAFLLGDGRQ